MTFQVTQANHKINHTSTSHSKAIRQVSIPIKTTSHRTKITIKGTIIKQIGTHHTKANTRKLLMNLNNKL